MTGRVRIAYIEHVEVELSLQNGEPKKTGEVNEDSIVFFAGGV